MPQDLDNILKLIDELREKLHKKAKDKPLTDPDVLKASQELDRVLDEFYKLLQQKKKKD